MNQPLRRPAAKIVTTFGAALASTYLAPSAEAAIVTLTPNPGSVPFSGGGTYGLYIELIPGAASFYQFNDTIGKSIGAALGLVGFGSAQASNEITANQGFASFLSILPNQAGTQTLGFLTTANQVGWIRINFGGTGGAVTYLAAAFNDTPGGSIHAGDTTPVPEPGSLALAALASLALGARGVRRLRESRKDS